MAQYDEVKSLTSDVLEIYSDWGTANITLQKFQGGEYDDLYDEGTASYSEPYKCIGRYKPTPVEEQQTGVGLKEDEQFYTVYVVKDTLDKQGVTSIETRDILEYNGNRFDILAVQYSAVIGDYALQYKIFCKGKIFKIKEL